LRRTRTALQIVSTLAVVLGIYVLPWGLAAAGSSTLSLNMELEPAPAERDPVGQVVWLPLDADAESQDNTDEPLDASTPAEAQPVASEQPASTPEPVESAPEPAESATPAPTVVAVAVTDPSARPTHPTRAELRKKRQARRARKIRRSTRAARAPRELTKKQERRRRLRARRRARLAKQRQCHELIDQIVPVDEGEFWVGRELVNCYRAHPRQFARIGGLSWKEDADDKRVGLRVRPSRRTRGDIARAVGFERNDVLRSLNGVPLRSTAGSGFAMIQLLGRKAKVRFLRGEQEHTVVLRVVGRRKLARAKARARARAADERGKVAER